MPDPIPGAPAGQNTAAFPAPKLDWVERVKATNERARALGKDIQLVFDGDSITDFFYPSDRGKEIWNARYAQYGAFNFAISGDRTQHVLWRLAQGQMEGLSPKLIVLLIGTNNIDRNTEGEVAEGIKAVVREYRKRSPESVILLQGVFPRGEKPADPKRKQVKAINEEVAKLHDGEHIIYVDLADKFLEPDGTLSRSVMPDSLHPNKKGYEIWADAIQPFVDKYLRP
jgi:lysophospholipase L1-like esterase